MSPRSHDFEIMDRQNDKVNAHFDLHRRLHRIIGRDDQRLHRHGILHVVQRRLPDFARQIEELHQHLVGDRPPAAVDDRALLIVDRIEQFHRRAVWNERRIERIRERRRNLELLERNLFEERIRERLRTGAQVLPNAQRAAVNENMNFLPPNLRYLALPPENQDPVMRNTAWVFPLNPRPLPQHEREQVRQNE